MSLAQHSLAAYICQAKHQISEHSIAQCNTVQHGNSLFFISIIIIVVIIIILLIGLLIMFIIIDDDRLA